MSISRFVDFLARLGWGATAIFFAIMACTAAYGLGQGYITAHYLVVGFGMCGWSTYNAVR